MQFDSRHRQEILDGAVTLTFRRWKRRQVIAGNRYRTSLGMVEVDGVDTVDPSDVTSKDAQRAGSGSVRELLAQVTGDESLPLYRIEFHVVDEPDPRSVLAATDSISDGERREIEDRLERLDRASKHGPWTAATLRLIADHPGTRAGDLAGMVGRDTPRFKTDVRKLKNLGLTESLEVGYRLSPRGRAYLEGAR